MFVAKVLLRSISQIHTFIYLYPKSISVSDKLACYFDHKTCAPECGSKLPHLSQLSTATMFVTFSALWRPTTARTHRLCFVTCWWMQSFSSNSREPFWLRWFDSVRTQTDSFGLCAFPPKHEFLHDLSVFFIYWHEKFSWYFVGTEWNFVGFLQWWPFWIACQRR